MGGVRRQGEAKLQPLSGGQGLRLAGKTHLGQEGKEDGWAVHQELENWPGNIHSPPYMGLCVCLRRVVF